MGADLDYRFYSGKLTPAEVKRDFLESVKDAQYRHGHGGYTGTIAEHSQGVTFKSDTLETQDEALEYLDENAEKWGPSLALKFKRGEELVWVVGGIYSC